MTYDFELISIVLFVSICFLLLFNFINRRKFIKKVVNKARHRAQKILREAEAEIEQRQREANMSRDWVQGWGRLRDPIYEDPGPRGWARG